MRIKISGLPPCGFLGAEVTFTETTNSTETFTLRFHAKLSFGTPEMVKWSGILSVEAERPPLSGENLAEELSQLILLRVTKVSLLETPEASTPARRSILLSCILRMQTSLIMKRGAEILVCPSESLFPSS